MTHPGEPEIIPPRKRSFPVILTDEQLEHLASLLDDIFNIPGTNIRFGLDPLIGLIPGLGDFITGIMSFLIIYGAWQRGLPKVTMARMFANIAIDTVVGIIPIGGDFFDAVWKSNRMNYNLLVRYRVGARSRLLLRDWLFFLLLLVSAAALVVLPIVIVVGIVHLLRGGV